MACDALLLFSGGLDSTVLLAWLIAQGRSPLALSFDYGQRHRIELRAAERIAAHYQIPHTLISLPSMDFTTVAKGRSASQIQAGGIAPTYIPARNTLMLSVAASTGERLGISDIFLGANLLDQTGYPDCRPNYIAAFNAMLQLGQQYPCTVHTPFATWDKQRIAQEGRSLQCPIDWSVSCYDPGDNGPCQECDACVLRSQAILQ